jgi:acyl transferase domain-containing protein
MKTSEATRTNSDVAIVGMACIFPGAPNVEAFWENILDKVCAISDPPPDWQADLFFDQSAGSNDRIYCKAGGYLKELAEFTPLEYGVMPVSIEGSEPDQFLALRVAHEALSDAGYLDRPFNREQTEVIIGRGAFFHRGYVTLMQHGLVVDQTIRLFVVGGYVRSTKTPTGRS